jgi:hypothetical protein
MRRPLLALTLVLASLALAASPAAAQRARRAVLMVHVADAEGRPLPRASVHVGGYEYGAYTDAAGNARLPDIPDGNRIVEVRRVGFGFQRVAADFAVGDTVRREFSLRPAPVELEGLTVTSWGRSMALRRSGFYDRQRRGMGAFMTSDRIEAIRPLQTNELFRQMRGFMLYHTPDNHDMVVTTRGASVGGSCLAQVYLDGMMLYQRDYLDQESAFNLVPPQDLEGIEAYAGAASIPAEYNPTGNACGVVLLWTKR